MINIIDKIFQGNGFKCPEELRPKEEAGDDRNTVLKNIYVNEHDEMYFVVEGSLDKNVLDEIIGICSNAESNGKIPKSYKSNWFLIFITTIEGSLSWEQRKRVLFIEENKYFCRKYVIWHNIEEKQKVEKLCGKDYSTENINQIIGDYENFCDFKKSDDRGYGCLSRIFIKLPFLNLADLKTTDKTINYFIKKQLNGIHTNLMQQLEAGNLDEIEEEMKYYINRLHICNFKPFVYEEDEEKPYVTIDFTNGDKARYSMILSGPNGYGKTSVFQAVYFALTGIIDTGNHVDGRKKCNEHVIINDLSKCCFVAVEFVGEEEQYFTVVRYTEKGEPGTVKKTEDEASDFDAYILEGKFRYPDFRPEEYEKKTREDIAARFGEKNIVDWTRQNYIQQEHESDIILKADKDRVNFLNQLIEMGTDDYFSEIKLEQQAVGANIENLEKEIKDLVQKVSKEVEEIQGEEPVCEKVFPELEYVWDKETYAEGEPFQEYEENAKHALEVINRLPEYAYKRKKDLLETIDNSEHIYKFYIMNLYDSVQKNIYKNSFLKKQYLLKLSEEGDELWKADLKENFLGEEFAAEIRQIRQKRMYTVIYCVRKTRLTCFLNWRRN